MTNSTLLLLFAATFALVALGMTVDLIVNTWARTRVTIGCVIVTWAGALANLVAAVVS